VGGGGGAGAEDVRGALEGGGGRGGDLLHELLHLALHHDGRRRGDGGCDSGESVGGEGIRACGRGHAEWTSGGTRRSRSLSRSGRSKQMGKLEVSILRGSHRCRSTERKPARPAASDRVLTVAEAIRERALYQIISTVRFLMVRWRSCD
jgi:hypothetical protein